MASLTTIIGFGSLTTASCDALSLMGLTVMLGITFNLLHALITLPAFLICFKSKEVK